MGVYTRNNIVTDGLILYFDIKNLLSYPGSGTSVYDLKSKASSTMTNGPTFVSSNQIPYISVDGTNDYIESSVRRTDLEFQPTQPFSVFCWIGNLHPTQSGVALLANMSGSSPYPGWDIYFDNTSSVSSHLISTWSTNAIKVTASLNRSLLTSSWNFLGYTYDGTCPATTQSSIDSINFYLNTIKLTGKGIGSGASRFLTTNQTITYNSLQRFRYGSRWGNGAAVQPGLSRLGSLYIYNKKLSENEILQNYLATKSRYIKD